MKVPTDIELRRAQLERLWSDDRYQFLAEYCRVVGRPANDLTMSLRGIIDQMIDREAGDCAGAEV